MAELLGLFVIFAMGIPVAMTKGLELRLNRGHSTGLSERGAFNRSLCVT